MQTTERLEKAIGEEQMTRQNPKPKGKRPKGINAIPRPRLDSPFPTRPMLGGAPARIEELEAELAAEKKKKKTVVNNITINDSVVMNSKIGSEE